MATVISAFHKLANSHASYLDKTLTTVIFTNINNEKGQQALSQFKELCNVLLIPKLKAFAAEKDISGNEDIINFEQLKSQLQGYIETLRSVEPILTTTIQSPKLKGKLEKIITG